MRRLLLALLLFTGLVVILRRMAGLLAGSRPAKAMRGDAPGRSSRRLVRDPVCLTYLPIDRALSIRGQGAGGADLWFCSDRCRSAWQSSRRAAS